MILIWTLLALPLVARGQNKTDNDRPWTFCKNKFCTDESAEGKACYVRYSDYPDLNTYESFCKTLEDCKSRCKGDKCCCHKPSISGQTPSLDCPADWRGDLQYPGKIYCYEGKSRKAFDSYPRTFPVYCTIDKMDVKHGTTSFVDCESVRGDKGCCCTQDDCNEDIDTCNGKAYQSFCGKIGCDDKHHVCHLKNSVVTCMRKDKCVNTCNGSDCCCYLPSQEKNLHPPLNCISDWKEDKKGHATVTCYEGDKARQFPDYPRLIKTRCSIDKKNQRSATQSKVVCAELGADGGCCCGNNACNRDLKTCRTP